MCSFSALKSHCFLPAELRGIFYYSIFSIPFSSDFGNAVKMKKKAASRLLLFKRAATYFIFYYWTLQSINVDVQVLRAH